MMTLIMGGCGDARLDELADQLEQIRQAPDTQRLLVVPSIPEYQPLAFTQDNDRSPFARPTSEGRSAQLPSADTQVVPELTRELAPLEHFSLQELTLVGMMQMNNRQRALIRTPEGEVLYVGQGDYIGQDNGQVGRVGDKNLEIDEHIFTQDKGWQQRKVVLVLGSDE